MKTRSCVKKSEYLNFATKDDLLLIEDYMRGIAPPRPKRLIADVAVIYARFSTKSQKENTIGVQEAKCLAYAKKHHIQLRNEQYLFADRAISGYELEERKALLEIRELARQGAISKILIRSYDRLSRRASHQAILFEEFTELGVEIHITGDNGYGHLDEIKNLILGLFAMKERQKILADTSDAIKAAAHEGRSVSPAPYGYGRGRRKGVLVVDRDEARVVRLIFYLFARGVAPINIAGILNRNKIPSPRGGLWTGTVIRGNLSEGTGILRNPKYIGLSVYGRVMVVKTSGRRMLVARDPREWITVRVDIWRIVSNRLWLRVQRRLKEVSIKRRSEINRERCSTKSTDIFHSRYYCSCGAKMNSGFGSRLSPYRALLCTNANAGTCSDGSISAGRIDAEILRAIRDDVVSFEALALYAEQYTIGLAEARQSIMKERSLLEARIEKLQRRIDGLTDAIAEAGRALSKDDFRSRDRYVEERSDCETKLACLTIPGSAPDLSLSDLASLRREIDELLIRMPFVAQTKEDWLLISTLRRLIQRVDIQKNLDGGFTLQIQASAAGFLSDVDEAELAEPDAIQHFDRTEHDGSSTYAPVRTIGRTCVGKSNGGASKAEIMQHLAFKAQSNIFGLTDEDWRIVYPLIPKYADARLLLDAALFALRTGQGLISLPAPFARRGIHQAIRRMVISGLWSVALEALETVQSPTVAGLDTSRFTYLVGGNATA
ncbi:recombinase family protein [Methylobacterium sp. NPDC080182]|uniref:recombinase family protein n=1 Tax=Methylobacterium sp. NPDC080182 TaxID=3390590 RepID=UPI003D0581D8